MAKNNKKGWLKRSLGLVAGAAILAAIGYGLMPRPTVVDVADVVLAPMTMTVDENGQTRVKDRFVVSAPITGDVGRPELRPGDRVEEGDILMRIAPLTPQLMDAQSRAQAEAQVAAAVASQRQARAAVGRAQAASQLAELSHERQLRLAESGAISRAAADRSVYQERARTEELTSARLGVRVADSHLRMARAALGRYSSRGNEEVLEVPAPIAGQVLRVLNDQQGVVQVGTPVVELGDPAGLEIVALVLTADAVLIAPGAPVRIERWGGEQPLEGHVQRVEPSAVTRVSSLGVEEQRVNVVIDIDSDRALWEPLGDGYRVEVRIEVWHSDETLQVPSSALFRTDDGWAAYRVAGNAAELVNVEVGRRSGLTAEVRSGLEASDRVLTHPSDSLEHGAEIRIR